MEVDKEIKLEDIESKGCVNCAVKPEKEYEGCIRCLELQDKLAEANDKCARLELDIGNKNSLIEGLEDKLGFVELKRLEIEDEVRVLKLRNQELEQSLYNGVEEEDKVTQLMIENNVLECENNKAESEVEVWKVKCKKLEMQVMELEKRLSTGWRKTNLNLPKMGSAKMNQVDELMNRFNGAAEPSAVGTGTENKANEDKDASGTPPIKAPSMQCKEAKGFKGDHHRDSKSRVRKCLDFAAEATPRCNISPLTPGGRSLSGPIVITDNDDDLNAAHMHLPYVDNKERKRLHNSIGVELEITPCEELTSKDRCAAVSEHQSDEKKTNFYIEKLPYLPTPKRKRVRRGVSCVISSESESNSDDNIPICQLRSKHLSAYNSENISNRESVNDSSSGNRSKELTHRRRLMRVGDCENNRVLGKCSYKSTGSQNNVGIAETANDTVGEDEMEEDDSVSEGESLGGFIVSSSDVSENGSASNCNDISENHASGSNGTFSGDGLGDSENASESSTAYNEIISDLRRERKDKMKWVNEGEMLADFGKYPELCMKAVCALYRQQTSEEKSCKATIEHNARGFSQIHAFIGSALAEFLIDGDPQGDMKKTVEELQGFNAKGVELCWKLGTHYSKQLFEIYKNKKDPFFHP